MKVMHHHPNGKLILSDLFFLEDISRFEVVPVEKDGVFNKKNIGLQLGDITEIRPGTHALGFIRTDSSERQAECLSSAQRIASTFKSPQTRGEICFYINSFCLLKAGDGNCVVCK